MFGITDRLRRGGCQKYLYLVSEGPGIKHANSNARLG